MQSRVIVGLSVLSVLLLIVTIWAVATAHAPSEIVVAVDEGCSLLLADVGLDEEVGDRGSVVFEVWGDGERLAGSGIVRGSHAAVRIAADLEGVAR